MFWYGFATGVAFIILTSYFWVASKAWRAGEEQRIKEELEAEEAKAKAEIDHLV